MKREIKKLYKRKQVTEGAGVKLNRVFGYYELNNFDPFLLLDHFESEDIDDFKAGFPFHPHRGIETITYLKKGSVEHQDKLGNKELITAGQVQWMTAGRGIYHQEMPGTDSGINGFQIWLNLPSKHKMTKAGYKVIKELPLFKDNKHSVTVISGNYKGVVGPGTDISTLEPIILDVSFIEKDGWHYNSAPDLSSFLYLYKGSCSINDKVIKVGEAALLTSGESIDIEILDKETSFLFVAGLTLDEPVSWWGPIVMNTEEDIIQVQKELSEGRFPES